MCSVVRQFQADYRTYMNSLPLARLGVFPLGFEGFPPVVLQHLEDINQQCLGGFGRQLDLEGVHSRFFVMLTDEVVDITIDFRVTLDIKMVVAERVTWPVRRVHASMLAA